MTLHEIMQKAVLPALNLLPPKMDKPQALVMMLAIGKQESRFTDRVQKGNGPGRGFWQFEKGGGVRGVMEHEASRDYARAICEIRGVPFERYALWAALATDDILAAAMARLLLWTDPLALPSRDNPEAAWKLYADRVWRPGRPHRETWDGFYREAVNYVYEDAQCR